MARIYRDQYLQSHQVEQGDRIVSCSDSKGQAPHLWGGIENQVAKKQDPSRTDKKFRQFEE
ncbi:hypothetical protein AMTR_s00032p00234530 [Amborella trichopoda]|uniref:Uncharacterized protein n=1 Tax=Amborella trichopoda TaxID=13333 RepID=U5D0X2_AMBTC|nr:hypothetical protein AMTR_s00032p00234530 [Amborella trichopoda]